MGSTKSVGDSFIQTCRSARDAVGWRSAALVILCILCVPTTAAARDTIPAYGDAVDWERSGPDVDRPNQSQIEFLWQLNKFDQAYAGWQTNRTADPQGWIRLARETFADYMIDDVRGEDGAFVLRGVLIRGECLAFAAIDLMHSNKIQAIQLLREAALTLDRVVNVGEANPLHNVLPPYSTQQVVMVDSSARSVHPWAGYDLVGTGSIGLAPDQSVSAIRSGNRYLNLTALHERSRAKWADIARFNDTARTMISETRDVTSQDIRVLDQQAAARYSMDEDHKQITSSEAARSLLAHICPWGAEIYSVMVDTGLVNEDLDFNVLYPFAAADPYHGSDAPKLSVTVLDEDAVPAPVRIEAEALVGGEDGVSQDILGLAGLKWYWVGDPTYTVWFVSPRAFDPSRSEQFGDFSDLIKLVSGGPLWLALDKLLSGVTSIAETVAGPGSSFYWGSKVMVENAEMGITEVIKDYVTIESIEWMKYPELVTMIGTIGLAMIDEHERQALYQGLDPKLLSLGRSYDGSEIPPIIVRADVMGFVAPPDDYTFWLHSERFYIFRPEEFAYHDPESIRRSLQLEVGFFEQMYFEHFGTRPAPLPRPGLNLQGHREDGLARGQAYLAGDESLLSKSWPRLPGHHGARVMKFSSAPFKQRIILPVSEDARKVIEQYGDFRLGVFANSSSTMALADTPLDWSQLTARIVLCTVPVTPDFNEPTVDPFDEEFCTTVDDLKSNYTLRITHAGRVVDEREIVLQGVGQIRKATGTLFFREPGDVEITLYPPLELPLLEAEIEELTPSYYHSGTGDRQ